MFYEILDYISQFAPVAERDEVCDGGTAPRLDAAEGGMIVGPEEACSDMSRGERGNAPPLITLPSA
jgi:hypothetical protein